MNEAQSVESKATQSVCAQCGSRLSATDGADEICINCLLRSAVAEDDDVDPGNTPPHSDQLIRGDNGTPVEFGDYELLEEIGRGSQGVVYRARQKNLNRIVALKVIALGHWATEPHVKRFRREAEAAARLNHPGIVPIYEVGERDGACYFSMGLVEGGQLDAMLEREPMSIRSAVELIVKLARTVQYAHEHNILHRDIKPGNILLDAKGEPHLTDFGLARLVEAESTVTRTREVLGTPSYMAPEQAAGETAKLGKATDVYGLGAVLYQLLTGHPPFAGGTTYETIRLLLNTEPRQPRVLNRKIDRDLSTICLKCLEKDPKRRYPSAVALIEDLEHWLKHEPIRAKRSGLFTHARKWVRRKPAIAALIASLVALAAAIGWNVWQGALISPPSALATNGIAVLPFENLSHDPDNAYFADGIQEEMLTRLASIADLKVISRTSTQRYQSKPRNLREIAKQLGVAHILEGSVQKAAHQVRVNVQLINAQTDSQLWADTYDRKLTDLFAVETEIATKIADTLQAKLTGSEKQAIAARPTENSEAHQLYLKGRYFLSRRTEEGLKKSVEFFNQAIDKDSSYALAYSGLADSNMYLLKLAFLRGLSRKESYERAKAAATKALELDDNLAEAHTSLALVKMEYEWDWTGSEREFQRAIQLDPGFAEAHHQYSHYLTAMGRSSESLTESLRALELDPLSLVLNAHLAWHYLYAWQYDQAIQQCQKASELDRNYPETAEFRGLAYEQKGMYQEAIAELQTAINLPGGSPHMKAELGHAYAIAGETTQALDILNELKRGSTETHISSYDIAVIHVGLGRRSERLKRLKMPIRSVRSGCVMSELIQGSIHCA